MIPAGTKIYSIRDLERIEKANGESAEEWKDLNDRVNKEPEVDPEREAELQAQYDEEAEISKENEGKRRIEEALTEGKSIQEIKDSWRLERGEPEGPVPSRLEPFDK